MNVSDQIEGFEERRYVAYPDPLTHGAPWTNGVGHTGHDVYPGQVVNDAQVDAWKTRDIAVATAGVMSAMPWAAQLNEPRQAVLIGMAFQLGLAGMVGFHNALSAAERGDYGEAGTQMLNSIWSKQTPKRAFILSKQMQTGNWPA